MTYFQRYVAIGDSTAEGLDDPYADGTYRGWADRLAELLAVRQGSVWYANLAIRGRTTRQILDEQLAPALAMKPDLAVVACGTNDLLRRHFDPAALRRDMETMQFTLRKSGATVITFTLPDLTDIMPIARLLRSRLLAMNDAIRNASATTGAILCDFAIHPVAADPRLWSDDRLHANSAGHARIAEALAYHLGLPDTSLQWACPLEGAPPRTFFRLLRAEAAWVKKHLAPWIWRHAQGRSSGDGIRAKRPEMRVFSS